LKFLTQTLPRKVKTVVDRVGLRHFGQFVTTIRNTKMEEKAMRERKVIVVTKTKRWKGERRNDPSNHPRRGLETPELVQQGRWLPRIQRAHLEAQSRRDELVPDLIVRQPDLPMLSIIRHFLPLLLPKSMSKSIRISAMGEQLLE
jgi:hypothetical protein